MATLDKEVGHRIVREQDLKIYDMPEDIRLGKRQRGEWVVPYDSFECFLITWAITNETRRLCHGKKQGWRSTEPVAVQIQGTTGRGVVPNELFLLSRVIVLIKLRHRLLRLAIKS